MHMGRLTLALSHLPSSSLRGNCYRRSSSISKCPWIFHPRSSSVFLSLATILSRRDFQSTLDSELQSGVNGSFSVLFGPISMALVPQNNFTSPLSVCLTKFQTVAPASQCSVCQSICCGLRSMCLTFFNLLIFSSSQKLCPL